MGGAVTWREVRCLSIWCLSAHLVCLSPVLLDPCFYYQGILTYLVSWCFEPSQPQRITSGLNSDFTLSPSYSFQKSSYYKSCFLSLFIFRGQSAREHASSRVTYFILRAYTECVSHINTGEIGRGFGKKCR